MEKAVLLWSCVFCSCTKECSYVVDQDYLKKSNYVFVCVQMKSCKSEQQRGALMLKSVQYLERYIYLILFNTYLHLEKKNSLQRSFSTWMQQVTATDAHISATWLPSRRSIFNKVSQVFLQRCLEKMMNRYHDTLKDFRYLSKEPTHGFVHQHHHCKDVIVARHGENSTLMYTPSDGKTWLQVLVVFESLEHSF